MATPSLALGQSVPSGGELGARPTDHESVRLAVGSGSPVPRVLFSGWLSKEVRRGRLFAKDRRRFFVLTHDSLEWFMNDKDTINVPHGRLLLEGVQVAPSQAAQLVLQPADGPCLVLYGDNLDGWQAAIRAQLAAFAAGRTRLVEEENRIAAQLAGMREAAAAEMARTGSEAESKIAAERGRIDAEQARMREAAAAEQAKMREAATAEQAKLKEAAAAEAARLKQKAEEASAKMAEAGDRVARAQAAIAAPTPSLPQGEALDLAATPAGKNDEWNLDAWVLGANVHRAVVAALQAALAANGLGGDSDAALGFMRAVKDRGHLVKLVGTKAVLDLIVDMLWQETQKLHGATAATNQEVHDKFVGAIELSYGGLDKFFGGLGEIVGQPDPNVDEAMDAEHLEGSESKQPFETGNYGVMTTSETEWLFVTSPTAAPPAHLDHWPEESPEKLPDRTKCRSKTSLAELDGALAERNEQLKENHHPEVILSELKAAKSYTGPVRPRPLPQTCALLCHCPRPSSLSLCRCRCSSSTTACCVACSRRARSCATR